uniref:Uncharacterized protein n=1 Tax=Escherichia coli TaxID=562 RepID=A0A6D1NVL7_ECOLX|nr:hypothetical protein [Escherichia coli]
MQDFNNSKGFYMKKDDLITRCKLLKGERDESIFTILIGIVVKLGLVGLALRDPLIISPKRNHV